YPIGYFHIDIAEVRTEEGKLHLFVAIDRTSKFAFAQLHEKANRHTATAFLKALIAVVPYKIHTILTDNGIQFCDLPKNRSGPTARWQTHMFDLLCRAHLDERAGRADEPYSQRGDCSALPLRQPPPASPTHANIPRRLQLRQASQDFEWAHAVRIRP